jgi:hypothetical protein
MTFMLPWLLFAIPAGALIICWSKLLADRRQQPYMLMAAVFLTLISAAVLLGFTALSWNQFIGPIAARDYRVETTGLLLSFGGIIAGRAVRQKHRHRYLGLGFAAALWTLAVYFLAASTY